MIKKYSRLLSLILRHKPEELGLTLDDHGWIAVTKLVTAVKSKYSDFSLEILDEVVWTNDKKRFEYDVTGKYIRACQGHSITVDLELQVLEPPEILYHGTTLEAWKVIKESSIQKRSRHAVHLSDNRKTAVNVGGRRHGRPVVLEILARSMHDKGFKFYRSANGVWLTDEVPASYIKNVIYPHEL